MFKTKFCGGEDFESSWKAERSENEAGTQTSPLHVKEVDCQAIERESVQVQTDNPGQIPVLFAPYDEKSLLEFLRRVGPPVCKELEKNGRSHAFVGYDLNFDEKEESISKLHSLSCSAFSDQGLRSVGLSWNCTGSVIAAAYGCADHEDWCEHKGGLCTWNLNRKDFQHDQPSKKIEYSCCLTSVKFHPEDPALVACGNFIGEVILWNISLESDMLVTVTATGEKGHSEAVTNLSWIKDSDSKTGKYLLVSCSLDGRILIWKQVDRTQNLEILHAFALLAENLPRSVRPRSNRLNAEVGVTSLSFNCEDKSVFIIGSEGGGVFQCSVYSELLAHAETTFSVPLKGPVTLTYDPHQGQIQSAHCSPFSRKVFLTCGADGEVRVYSLHQASRANLVVHSEESFSAAQWSPVRPAVFAAVTAGGNLCLYDLRTNRSSPVVTLPVTEKSQSVWLVEFNKTDPKLLCTATSDGTIQVWSMVEKLVTQSGPEYEVLEELSRIDQE